MSTRVLSPGKAVVWAAFFNFVAAFGFGTAVARTVGAGMVDLAVVTYAVIFAGLIGAIVWDLITWYWGLPTSSSHALFGGYAGAAIAKAGFGAVIASGWTKTLLFIVLAPMIGMGVGLVVMNSIYFFFATTPPSRVDRWFRRLQLASAAGFSLMHGANDAQKTMGIIAGALVTGGYLQMQNGELPIPFWVVLSAHTAIGLGTLTGGWRIIHTMGSKITKAASRGRICSRNRSSCRHLYCDHARCRHQHDAHHYRSDRGRQRDASAFGRPVGRRPTDCLGVGVDDSCGRPDWRDDVLGAQTDVAVNPA